MNPLSPSPCVVARWLAALVDAQGPGTDPATATRTATLVIATIRGLLLDLLTADGFLAALVCDHASCDADA
jgi:hypothetical protein